MLTTHDPKPGSRAAAGRSDDATALHREYARTRDPRIREELVARYAPLARGVARRFAHRGESLEDLIQVAMLGLLKAIDRFDPARGTRFSSYAVPTVLGEVKRHFRDHRWGARVPRSVQETYLGIRQANEDLTHELGRAPTVADIADYLNVPPDQVLEAREAGGTFHLSSLDDPNRRGELPAAARLAGSDAGFEAVEARQVVARLLAQLPERERRIVRMRFQDEMTQSQIAGQEGVSQMQVSRLLSRSFSTMRSFAQV